MRWYHMLIRRLLAAGFLLTAAAWSQDRGNRESLLGTWQVEEGATHETWSLESKGEILQVVRTDDGKVTLDVKCKPDGSDCRGTDEGKKVVVSTYYNGSALVEMETKDTRVTTRKFAVNGQTDRMIIDVNPITDSGKPYTLRLTRHLQASAR